ncbi:hypothetical protein ACTVKO_23085 [Serratia nevei]|uniref:hypothetical protein n=1 Tax=Serratia nevei TaxID=2703794 RepID=UPI003FA7A585
MTIGVFSRMAAKMDHHMQQLDIQGITEQEQIIDRMIAYTLELHQIWNGATDKEFMALTREYPRFSRYSFIMEKAFEQEHLKLPLS